MTLHDIAVGLDGSEDSADALRWAIGLAEATTASVRAISSWQMPLIASLPSSVKGLPSQAFMATRAAEALESAIEAAAVDPALPREVREGHPGQVLAAETATADLVVVGRTGSGRRHGISRVAEALLGSVARHCLHHAQGPVAAIPSQARWIEDPVVVVGVDGSPASHAALAWALEQLPATAQVHAVRTIPPYLDGLLALDSGLLDRVMAATGDELATSIATAVAHLPAGAAERITPHVLVELARNGLIEPGFDVDLIVVGERGRGAIAARMLGSVSDHVVRNARCPVIVVPAPTESTS